MNIQSLPSRLNKKSKIKDIKGNMIKYTVVDECVFFAQSNSEKAYALHKLKFDDGREVFRIGYYMIAQKPRTKGKWAWGQYAPMMTKQDMITIFKYIKGKKWI